MATEKKTPNVKGQAPIESVESGLTKIEKFIENNQKKISYVVGGIIVIVLAIFGYNKFILQPKEKEAYEQMFMAEYYFKVDSLNYALNGDGTYPGFYDITNDYKWTSAKNLAHYYIGMILMKQGLFEDAIDELENFKSKDQILGAMAKGAIGDAYVELGDLDQALDYYLEAANNRPNFFVTPIFLSKAAWVCEQQGEYQQAIDIYTQIKTEHFRSFESREADKNIAYLEAKLNME
jgi:tetratricopeptide (TPR) repeat protein